MSFQVTKRGLRFTWWVALTASALVTVRLRWATIWTSTGTLSELDRGLLVLLVLLLLLPIISEFEGFGFKLRSQLDAFKHEVTTAIRLQFQALSQNLNVQTHIHMIPPPTAKEVKEIEKTLTTKIGEGLAQQSLSDLLSETEQELAVIRQAVEREVWRIWRTRCAIRPLGEPPPVWPHNATQAVQQLLDQEMLPQDLARAAQMVLWFAGPEPPPDQPGLPRADQERFVREVGRTIIQRLKNQSW